MSNNIIIKSPIASHVCRYITLCRLRKQQDVKVEECEMVPLLANLYKVTTTGSFN